MVTHDIHMFFFTPLSDFHVFCKSQIKADFKKSPKKTHSTILWFLKLLLDLQFAINRTHWLLCQSLIKEVHISHGEKILSITMHSHLQGIYKA